MGKEVPAQRTEDGDVRRLPLWLEGSIGLAHDDTACGIAKAGRVRFTARAGRAFGVWRLRLRERAVPCVLGVKPAGELDGEILLAEPGPIIGSPTRLLRFSQHAPARLAVPSVRAQHHSCRETARQRGYADELASSLTCF